MTEKTTSAPHDQTTPDGGSDAPVSLGIRLRYILPAVVVVALFVVLGTYLFDEDRESVPTALEDKPAPEFDLPPVQGFEGGFKTADLKGGQVALVNIFASWCGPCRIEHPLLMELAESNTLPIYGINYKDTPDDAESWLGRFGNPYTKMGADISGRTGIDWGVYGVPETFVIDGSGRIRYKHIGVLTRQDLDEKILPAIETLRQ
jgi:cytochrome c biogenesis protein CcmG/thiol:disulfide interchange protein DsbE